MSQNMKIMAFSGDLLNRQTQHNKRRHSFFGSSEEEVLVGFSSCFDDFATSNGKNLYNLRSTNEIKSVYPETKCNNYPRCHELTVKLFINRISNDVVTRGLQTVLAELELDFADNLILSFDNSATNKMIETTWKQAEKEKKIGRVNQIGISDLSKDQLENLCEWSSISPDIHQISPINYDCCGSTVQDIMAVAAKYNIRTTSHGDPVADPIKMTLDLDRLLDHTNSKWSTDYTVRYVQRSKDRNIITKKGYAMEIIESC